MVVVAAALLVVAAAIGVALKFSQGAAQGTLVSLTTGRPIAGATIQAKSGIIRTDRSGRFVVPNLPVGAHVVTVTIAGFAPFNATLDVRLTGSAEEQIKLPDASVGVLLNEIGIPPRVVISPTVQIAGATASLTASGTYVVRGLRPGPTPILVTAPSHEPTETTITVRPGNNNIVVSIYLTPAETYSRYFQAFQSGKWSVAYSYLHPDVAKLESLHTFKKDMQSWGTPLSLTLGKTRMLPRWTSPYTNATYTRVAVIGRTLVGESRGVRYTNTMSQHWTNVDGLWLRVDIR